VEADVIAPIEQSEADRSAVATEVIVAPDSQERFLNKELSWCDFAHRLLDLASDESVPLLERVKFMAICASGMDEFFQVRVAGLKDQIAAGVRKRSSDGKTASQQLKLIYERVTALRTRQDRIFNHALIPQLAHEGVDVAHWSDLDMRDRQILLGGPDAARR
jgi:polyphosphate kinase